MRNTKKLLNILACIALAGAANTRSEEPFNVPSGDSSKVRYDPRDKSEMDDLASSDEIATFAGAAKVDALLFTEDRAHSIRWARSLPKRWLNDLPGHTGVYKGRAQPGEFFVFQIGAFAAKRDLNNLALTFNDLAGDGGKIEAARLRCFNLGGTNRLGQPFSKTVNVNKGNVQALWVGVDIPQNAKGLYQGTLSAKDASGLELPLKIALSVEGETLTDHGDRDSWRLSRLRWLDSSLGLDDDTVTQPYLPIVRDGNSLALLGRKLTLGPLGLPARAQSFFDANNTGIVPEPSREIFAAPFTFAVETEAGLAAITPTTFKFVKEQKGAVSWSASGSADGIALNVEGLLEYDGFANVVCTVKAARDLKIKDIRLEIQVNPDAATYFMGLQQPSGKRPASVDWHWNENTDLDGFWMGAVNAGFKIQLYGANWRPPLVNCYYQLQKLHIPESWGGVDGKSGGIRISESPEGKVQATAYSGARDMKSGEALTYGFRLWLTPFKTLNTNEQWSLRYLHKQQGVEDGDYRNLSRVKDMGANVINIHHNKEQNPTINYPYFDASMPLLKKCVEDAHANGIKVKIYYTTREVTTNLPELFAFWSLNGEIINPGPGKASHTMTNPGGPHPWLIEHLGETGYIPAWREVIGGRYKGLLDLAVLTAPESRMDNFYVEGLAYTLRETDFDGMYIDDTALDRKAFQRAHRVFESAGKHLLVDMHSCSHQHPAFGSVPSAMLFMQNFPYYHRLWFGEGHNYNAPPEHWLVELSGIPFGLMGEMLQGGGNKWRGMLFGMTQRLGWSGNPRPQWKFFDEFGMNDSSMIGFYNPACPVKTGRKDILATVYKKGPKALICVASWSAAREKVKLEIDWPALGLDPNKTTLWAPDVEGFQPEAVFAPGGAISIEPGKGWMLVADETPRQVTGGPTFPDPVKGLPVKASEATPFEIDVPANTVRTRDIPWPASATVAVARLDPKSDEGQTWGLGMAVGWAGEKYVQMNLRTDGQWQIRRNGQEHMAGAHPGGKAVTVAIKLGAKIQCLAKEDNEDEWNLVAEFPRGDFAGAPEAVRVGKIGATWKPRDNGEKGAVSPCRVEWVKIY